MSVTAARSYGHLIAGERVDFDADATFPRHSPADGALLAEFADGGTEAVERAAAHARAAFDAGPWPHTSGQERAQTLLRWAELVRDDAEQLARLEAEEVGKPIRFAREDVGETADLIAYAGSLALQAHGESFGNLGPSYLGLTLREPVGVVAALIPWNFPTVIYAQKVPFALAAGCTVVVKPSEFAASSLFELTRLAHRAGVPPAALNVVSGAGPRTGRTLVASPHVDMVSFTGSTATGRAIASDAGRALKRSALELGGKGATIVLPDADLDAAVEGALFGAYLNQGETCCAGTRLLVHEQIEDELLSRLLERARELRVGDPMDDGTDVGALIHESHLERVLGIVADGRRAGATVLTGGGRLDRAGWFMEPTILTDVDPAAAVVREEIFGPVLSVLPFGAVEQAIAIANAGAYGLADSVWTSDLDVALRMTRALRSGTVWVNTSNDGALQLPFGGMKDSGFGREKGAAGLDEFTEVKAVQLRIAGASLGFRRAGATA